MNAVVQPLFLRFQLLNTGCLQTVPHPTIAGQRHILLDSSNLMIIPKVQWRSSKSHVVVSWIHWALSRRKTPLSGGQGRVDLSKY